MEIDALRAAHEKVKRKYESRGKRIKELESQLNAAHELNNKYKGYFPKMERKYIDMSSDLVDFEAENKALKEWVRGAHEKECSVHKAFFEGKNLVCDCKDPHCESILTPAQDTQ